MSTADMAILIAPDGAGGWCATAVLDLHGSTVTGPSSSYGRHPGDALQALLGKRFGILTDDGCPATLVAIEARELPEEHDQGTLDAIRTAFAQAGSAENQAIPTVGSGRPVCGCGCHKRAGLMHIQPCCGPGTAFDPPATPVTQQDGPPADAVTIALQAIVRQFPNGGNQLETAVRAAITFGWNLCADARLTAASEVGL